MRSLTRALLLVGACALSHASACTTDVDCDATQMCATVQGDSSGYAHQTKLCVDRHGSTTTGGVGKGRACTLDEDCKSPFTCQSKRVMIDDGEYEERSICWSVKGNGSDAHGGGMDDKFVDQYPITNYPDDDKTQQPEYVAVIRHDPQVLGEQGRIRGKVTFKRRAEGGVSIVAELVTDAATASNNHAMHVHVSPVDFTGKCSTAGAHYDPTNKETVDDYKCDANTPAQCYAGDLSGKHGAISVWPVAAQTLTLDDPNLNLNDLNGRSVVVHMADGGSPRVACGTIKAAKGGVHVVDESGGSSTGGTTTGGLGRARACSYDSECESPLTCQVRKVMVEDGQFSERQVCWEVADKHPITNYPDDNKAQQPEYVAVIRHDPQVLEVQGRIRGKVTFKQRAEGGVSIVAELVTDAATASNNHAMHVHVSPVDFTGKCSTAGAHYDPTNKETVDDYKCDANTPAQCYAGDLSGKHGAISVWPVAAQTLTLEDPNLNLNDLNGRSVVVHMADGGAPRVACGTIKAAKGGVHVVDESGGSSTGGATTGGLGRARACSYDSECESPLTCQVRKVMVEDGKFSERQVCWEVTAGGLGHARACSQDSECKSPLTCQQRRVMVEDNTFTQRNVCWGGGNRSGYVGESTQPPTWVFVDTGSPTFVFERTTSGPTAGSTAGPTAGSTAGPTAGSTPGPTAESTAGSTAGPTAGSTPGPTAESTVGSTAGSTAGPTAGPTAGSTAGLTAGSTAPSTAGPTAGPTAGSTTGSTAGPTAGPTGLTAGLGVTLTATPTASPVVANGPHVFGTDAPTAAPTGVESDGGGSFDTSGSKSKGASITAGQAQKPNRNNATMQAIIATLSVAVGLIFVGVGVAVVRQRRLEARSDAANIGYDAV